MEARAGCRLDPGSGPTFLCPRMPPCQFGFARAALRCALLSALACLGFSHAAAQGVVRELVHAYPPNGLPEVVGATPLDRVPRTLQPYSLPAFTDWVALHVARALQGASDEPVAVTRMLRGRGIEAALAVSSAPPDGGTVLLASRPPVHTRATHSWRSRGPLALRPVALVATMPYVLVTHALAPLELHRLSTSGNNTPQRVLIASTGSRSISHAGIARLRHTRDAIEALAYNGGSAALQALAVREVEAALVPLPAALPYLRSDRLKVFAIADERRHPLIRSVPTTSEAAISELAVAGWFGLFAPEATPRPVIAQIEALLAAGAESAEAQEIFASFGLRLEHLGADAFAARLAEHGRTDQPPLP
jgi:tripartite-type tricarboxylate transporter receptor subunit TctC